MGFIGKIMGKIAKILVTNNRYTEETLDLPRNDRFTREITGLLEKMGTYFVRKRKV